MRQQSSSVAELDRPPVENHPAMVSMLTPEGIRVPGGEYEVFADALDVKTLQDLFRDMSLQRRFDTEATALQRQGELALFPPALGQEAAQTGLGHALRPQDFVFTSYREHGVALSRGLTPADILKVFRGSSHGGWDPQQHNFHNYEIIIGAQSLHATGYAMGVRLEGRVGTGDSGQDVATVACFGDGATSEGDVSEALTFAGAFNAPVLFYCQNNQWAISEPTRVQTSAPLYRRGEGFGVPGIRVDGNDVIATYAVARYCLERIRAGHGPMLIEAYTYRMGAHTTADDPTKYRSAAEAERWAARDPLDRLRRHLSGELGVPGDFLAQVEAEVDDFAAALRRDCVEMPDPEFATIFDHAYSTPHPLVEEERAWYADYLASSEDGPGSDGAEGARA
ncbi:thiamine pyrophosphate-dependent dehydrogenase E1 component subunit alpha [Citricoccus sp.]|uniref:thiamine pyrophosphate-dependent dehydrogenase E1 component subunit alpha n=1 Tax=Citricoccus sp. TaxID=1978372 RepID=UPI0028BE9A32|nr:thiamine pyrophosphate-dependent dehydrogenase E1 component subunit alpha [Citricoccus sp.]